MKRLTPPAAWQRRLALVDTPALAIPGQQELTLASMELLVQVARQIAGAPRSPSEKSCSLRSQTVGVDLVRSELTFE